MAERQSAWMSKITNGGLTGLWHRMLYGCTHVATVGVKGLFPRNAQNDHVCAPAEILAERMLSWLVAC